MRIELLALLAFLPASAASISGLVKDPSGAAVAQALVRLEAPSGLRSAATDANGRFEFRDVPGAEARLTVTHEGFEPFSERIDATASSVPLVVTLKLAELKTVVEVSGARLRNSDQNYQALRGGELRGVYRVKDLVLTRDAATFTFRSGAFSFLPPVLGRVTAGVFLGDGNFQLKPAYDIGAKHLKMISGAEAVDEDFTSLVVYFTDATFDEIAARAEKTDESPKPYRDALHRAQERLRSRDDVPETHLQRLIDADDVPNMEADLLAELYNHAEGSFRALIPAKTHPGLRFVLNPAGAIPQLPAPEEVALLNFDPSQNSDGIWYLSHTMAELRAGRASSAEEKRLIAPEHYRIEAAISNNLRMAVTCNLQFHSLRDGVRAVKFDLLPDMQVARLAIDGREIPFVQENRNRDGSFYALLPEPLARGQHEFTFQYEGGGMIRDLGGRAFLIIPAQPWYPRIGVTSRATFDMTFRTPRDAMVIATGERVKRATENGQAVAQWISEAPIPLAGFNYGYFNSDERTDKLNGFTLETWINAAMPRRVVPSSTLVLDEAENAMRVFEHWFGEPPYKRLAITEARLRGTLPGVIFTNLASMIDESSRYSALAETAMRRGDQPLPVAAAGVGSAYTGPRFDETLPREASRQWWGALVDAATFHDEWLIRGLIDFSGSVYDMAAERGTNDFLEHWRLARTQLLEKTYWGVRLSDAAPLWLGAMAEPLITQRGPDPPPHTPCPPAQPSVWAQFIAPCTALTGMKGGYVIHMLRRLMFDPATGDQDFIAMMRDFTSTFASRSVTTEAFKQAVEKHMKPAMDLDGNHRMDWFFREWVYGTELPSYKLEYSLTHESGKPVLHGKLTQSGVSAQFRMRVPIYAKLGAKTIVIGALNMTGDATREFRAEVPEEPKKVSLNASYDVLCAEAEVKRVMGSSR